MNLLDLSEVTNQICISLFNQFFMDVLPLAIYVLCILLALSLFILGNIENSK